MRINKFLASCGVSSRRKAEEFIKLGKVTLNGKVITDLATIVDETKDTVSLNGEILKLPEQFEYYMLNKPKGYVCTVADEHGRKTVMDLIKIKTRVFPVGRLDYDSEGMLILTNDGELTYKLTHPSNEVEKKYMVKIEGTISESEMAVLRAGVVIDGEKFSRCRAKVTKVKNNLTKLEMVLHEGKNREIRRMMEAIGKTVVLLNRVQIGKLKLGGISRGEYRALKPWEVEMLLH
ncbi:MAG: rRNA pseudouridine synthase [Christensenellaceae bacterium]|jgi:23S rRNA pseudouridine2605 synthase|nr:rRNA pseudouridine synthase [Christensenellaceae bacterium]